MPVKSSVAFQLSIGYSSALDFSTTQYFPDGRSRFSQDPEPLGRGGHGARSPLDQR